ncbi:MAG: DHH family phosphoesterase [Bacteroidaceae bacterium]|nr:DHH family phosphoesterase [Bacteroidaceae bacterium]
MNTFFRGFCLLAVLTLMSACEKETEFVYVPVKDDLKWTDALRQLNWGDGTTYVVGHKTPDVDAVCSAVGYAALMKSLGYKCEARAAGEANRETKYLQKRLGIYIPQVLGTLEPADRFIMTDHSEYIQSVSGAESATLLQIIDHHSLGNATSSNPLFYRSAPVGATCTLVFTAYRDFGVDIPDTIAKSLLAGILSDTGNRTSMYTGVDSTAYTELAAQLHIAEEEAEDIYKGMVEASCSYDGMTDEEIYYSDAKEYEIAGVYLGIGSLDWYDASTFDSFLERILVAMQRIRAEKGMQMIFCKVDIHSDPPYTPPTVVRKEPVTYIIYDGEGAKEIMENAYGPSVGKSWVNSGRKLSRKADLVPVITDALKHMAGE